MPIPPFGSPPPKNKEIYDAVVATSGGDFTLLSLALADGAKSIYIKAGTYVETADVDLSDDVFITGEGRDRSIIDFDNSSFQMDTAGGIDILIENIQIKNSTDTLGGLRISVNAGITVRNCYFNNNSKGIVVNAAGSPGPVIEGNLFNFNDNQDIRLDGGDKCIIIGNKFFSNADVFLSTDSNGNIIANNVFNTCELIITGEENVISNNSLDKKISVSGTSGNGNSNIIQGNYIKAPVGYTPDLIDIGTDNNLILNNIILDGDSDGIILRDDANSNIISGNRVTGCTAFGVNIAASTEDNNILTVNNLAGNTSGAFDDNGTNTQIGLNITS